MSTPFISPQDEIAAEGIVQPGEFSKLVENDVSLRSPRDIYYDFRRAKNHIFSEYALRDGIRFFDVIARSNAKFWQSIGEQSPVQLSANLPLHVVAQVTLERIYKGPSIVKFIELMEELKDHIDYASSILSIHGEEDVNDAKLPDAIVGAVRIAFNKFNLDDIIQIDSESRMHSGLVEDDNITSQSKTLSEEYESEVLAQYVGIIKQNQKQKSRWRHSKVSITIKFPIISVGSEWKK